MDDSEAKTSGEDDQTRYVPLTALEAERQERQSLARQVAELKGHLEGMKSTTEKSTEKTYTNAELQQFVDKGTLTEVQAQEIRDKQLRASVSAETRKAVKDELTASQRNSQVQSTMSRYQAALPTLNDTGSAERKKAETEFQALLDMGYDRGDPRTELMAVRAAFGPVEALEAAKSRDKRETHQEGGSGSSDGGKDDGSGWPQDMPSKQRRYYEEKISRKVYTKDKALKEWTDFKKSAA